MAETTEVTLQIPLHWPHFNEFFGYEPKPAFRIFDAAGNELPYQRLQQPTNRRKLRIHTTKFPEAYRTHDVSVTVPVNLPALGYTTLPVRAEPSRRAPRYPAPPVARHGSCRNASSLRRGRACTATKVAVARHGGGMMPQVRAGPADVVNAARSGLPYSQRSV